MAVRICREDHSLLTLIRRNYETKQRVMTAGDKPKEVGDEIVIEELFFCFLRFF